ncbi:hypothetical protein CUJ84_Chr002855 [Rhizobium leguminosarum]|uniref:Uncharacterized protein n=1 Tax=Rhizobium leguminosarum TaxID=384 RepID=A0A2K9Z4P4_RHILE|nr:hypothetical protein CUJ84_Chr002855 [Rhizobium leguminosarum]
MGPRSQAALMLYKGTMFAIALLTAYSPAVAAVREIPALEPLPTPAPPGRLSGQRPI